MPTETGMLKQNGRWSGYAGLLGARMKELFREPEVVFWIFLFPSCWHWDWVSLSAINRRTK